MYSTYVADTPTKTDAMKTKGRTMWARMSRARVKLSHMVQREPCENQVFAVYIGGESPIQFQIETWSGADRSGPLLPSCLPPSASH